MNDADPAYPESAPPRRRIVEIDGERGAITEMGHGGPVIVLLPSMLVLGRSYAWLTRILARRFRLLVIEMPGCGGGSVLSRAWSFEQYAEWLAKLLEQMRGVDRPALVGHSNSGPVALLVAAERPSLVGRLIIADSVGAEPPRSLVRVLGGRAIDAVLEARLTVWGFHHIVMNMVGHWRNFWNQVRLAVKSDLADVALRVRAPCLVPWGRRDHTMPLEGAHRLAGGVAGARLHISPDGSHDWLITHAEEFAEAVGDFLDKGDML